MSFDEDKHAGTTSRLNFMLATFALNGTLVNVAPWTDQLLLCDPKELGNFDFTLNWLQFGVGLNLPYACDMSQSDFVASSLHHSRSIAFYQLYLVDDDLSWVPIPVRVLNYQDRDGTFVNINRNEIDIENDQLSYRYVTATYIYI
jgi:hypothetical protein